jgi:hypothetical protein
MMIGPGRVFCIKISGGELPGLFAAKSKPYKIAFPRDLGILSLSAMG